MAIDGTASDNAVSGAHVDAANPTEAFAALAAETGARLVDVRTRPEWTFVGGPDLTSIGKQVWPIEWKSFPSMEVNQAFGDVLEQQLKTSASTSLFFICRSGGRSLEAALAMAARPAFHEVRLVNVVEGFEGDPNADGRRGLTSGWKARNLPWRQS